MGCGNSGRTKIRSNWVEIPGSLPRDWSIELNEISIENIDWVMLLV
jgi:hypothetical protein